MAFAINITDGRGLSNEVCREQGNAILAFPFIVNSCLTRCTYITNKTEHFSFKSRRDVQVSKLIKQDWPIVLR